MAGKRQTYQKPMALVGAHARNASLSSAVTLAAPSGANALMIQALTQNVRYTLDGSVPTASQGFQLAAGALTTIPVGSGTTVKLIEETGSASVEYQWGTY